jgi:hypothetical protein
MGVYRGLRKSIAPFGSRKGAKHNAGRRLKPCRPLCGAPYAIGPADTMMAENRESEPLKEALRTLI